MLITEEHINKTILFFESQGENEKEELIREMFEQQALLASYLFSEDTAILTEREQDYYGFLISFFWKICKDLNLVTAQPTAEIELIADENWKIILDRGGQSFRDSLTSVFDQYPEIEALAFIEDSLVLEENDFLSTTGRDYIFVMSKTLIDFLVA